MPWLATVARRIVIDDKRRKERAPAETGGRHCWRPPAADTTDELLRRCWWPRRLQSLSPAHREVLNETILRDRTVTRQPRPSGSGRHGQVARVLRAQALRVVLRRAGGGGMTAHTRRRRLLDGPAREPDRASSRITWPDGPGLAPPELAELSPMKGLLRGWSRPDRGTAGSALGESASPDLVRRRVAQERRRRPGRWRWGRRPRPC